MDKTVLISLISSLTAVVVSIITGTIALNTAKKQKQSNDSKQALEFLNLKLKALETAYLEFKNELTSKRDRNVLGKKDFTGVVADFVILQRHETNILVDKVGKFLGYETYAELKKMKELIDVSMAKISGEVNFELKMKEDVRTIPIDSLVDEVQLFQRLVEESVDTAIVQTVEKIEKIIA